MYQTFLLNQELCSDDLRDIASKIRADRWEAVSISSSRNPGFAMQIVAANKWLQTVIELNYEEDLILEKV